MVMVIEIDDDQERERLQRQAQRAALVAEVCYRCAHIVEARALSADGIVAAELLDAAYEIRKMGDWELKR